MLQYPARSPRICSLARGPGCITGLELENERPVRAQLVPLAADGDLKRRALVESVALGVVPQLDAQLAPAEAQREPSDVHIDGRRELIDSWPPRSRTPPKPNTSACHTPAAEAMWTPSEALPATSARSMSSA